MEKFITVYGNENEDGIIFSSVDQNFYHGMYRYGRLVLPEGCSIHSVLIKFKQYMGEFFPKDEITLIGDTLTVYDCNFRGIYINFLEFASEE